MKTPNVYAVGYKKGFDDGYQSSIVMVLKVVMASLYSHEWPLESILEMRDDIQEAIFFYAKHPDKLEEDVKTMEENGVLIRFNGKEK